MSNPIDRGVLVLTSLADGDKHGYAIMKDIEQIAGVLLGPGSLYGALDRLKAEGLVTELPDMGRRRMLRISDAGRAALEQELKTQARLARIGLSRLAGVNHLEDVAA